MLPVLDVPSAAERFRRLGFDVELVDPDFAAYAYVRRDQVVLHLSGVEEHPENGDVCVYLHVENADLAAGYGRVLVLSPFGGRSRMPREWGIHLAAQVDELRASGSRVETIFPGSEIRDLFGANAADPSTRPRAARAGYDQGRAFAEQVAEFWR